MCPKDGKAVIDDRGMLKISAERVALVQHRPPVKRPRADQGVFDGQREQGRRGQQAIASGDFGKHRRKGVARLADEVMVAERQDRGQQPVERLLVSRADCPVCFDSQIAARLYPSVSKTTSGGAVLQARSSAIMAATNSGRNVRAPRSAKWRGGKRRCSPDR